MIYQLATVFGKIVLMIVIGFLFAKAGVLSEDMKKHLSTLLMKIVLPFNILSSAGQLYDARSAKGMMMVIAICGFYYLFSLVVLTILRKQWPDKVDVLLIDLLVFANVGFIGFPLLGEMFGEVGTLYTVAYNIGYQLFFFSYGMCLLEGKEKLNLRNLLGNQIIYISVLAIILYFLPFRFPDFIQSVVSSIGGMMVPLSMMIIGCEIAQMKWKEILTDRRAYFISVLRLWVMPMIMLVILKALHIDSVVAKSAVILTALPCGSLTVIAAQQNGIDSKPATRAVAQTTLLMVLTLPVVFLLTEKVFG